MLYIFHGSDMDKSSAKARVLVASLRAKKPDAAFVRIDGNSWNKTIIEENIGGQGLFSSKSIIFLDRVMENIEAREVMPGMLPSMKSSENIFIILENKIDAEIKKSFSKYADKILSSDKDKIKKDDQKKVFALADALGERAAVRTWGIYRELLDGGASPESLLGTIFWQVKCMVLATRVKTAGEAGLNPFVYSKSKCYVNNFLEKELDGLLEKLVVIYHDGHRGLCDMSVELERFVLEI